MNRVRRTRPAAVRDAAGVRFDVDELLALRRDAARLGPVIARSASSSLAGGHRAKPRGRGMEYVESRPYMPGDDVRSIDWRVTARTGRAHTKLFQEERERPVSLVVDLAPSMFFGTRRAFKSVLAARACALVAWSVVTRGDRVGALVAAGERHLEIRPAGGQRGALAVIRGLVALGNEPPQAGAPGGLAGTLLRARRVLRPGSLILVFSDFYGLDEDCVRHLSRLRGHDEVVACWTHDVLESEPPPPGRYPVTNGREFTVLDLRSAEVRERYAEHVDAYRARVLNACARLSMPLVALRTDNDPVLDLARGLAAWSPVPTEMSS
jgi:uncharacterized protein (DUF58 family)